MEIQQHTKVTDLRGRSALTRSLEFGAFAPATGRPGFDKFTRFRLVLQVYVEGKTSLFFFLRGGEPGRIFWTLVWPTTWALLLPSPAFWSLEPRLGEALISTKWEDVLFLFFPPEP